MGRIGKWNVEEMCQLLSMYTTEEIEFYRANIRAHWGREAWNAIESASKHFMSYDEFLQHGSSYLDPAILEVFPEVYDAIPGNYCSTDCLLSAVALMGIDLPAIIRRKIRLGRFSNRCGSLDAYMY